MKLFDILESRSQEQVHRNPSVNTLKSLARNNKYHSARFVITKDGDVVAADSANFTHHSMAPYDDAWAVRGYVQYMDDGSYLYRSMQVYSALNKDHPILRIWENAGILNGNPDQSHLTHTRQKQLGEQLDCDILEADVPGTNFVTLDSNQLKEALAYLEELAENIDSDSVNYSDNTTIYNKLDKDYKAITAVEYVMKNNLKVLKDPQLAQDSIFLYDIDDSDLSYIEFVGAIHVVIANKVAEVKWIGSYDANGAGLLRAAMKIAKDRGALEMTLEAKWQSEGFYTKMGFEQAGPAVDQPFSGSQLTPFKKKLAEKWSKKYLKEASSVDHMLMMDPHSFDQSSQGWRSLVHADNMNQAIQVLQSYIQKYVKNGSWANAPQGDEGLDPHMLTWHLGQLYAMQNKYDQAIKWMQQSHNPQDSQWSDYVAATIAFLKGDKQALLRYAQKDNYNRDTIERLAAGVGEPYSQVYEQIDADAIQEAWSKKYKKSINCNRPQGFSQRAHCAARNKRQAGKLTKSKRVSENMQHASSYDAWIRYTPASLESDWREYVHKQDTKWRNRARVIGARWPMFDSMDQFRQALDQARIVNVDELGDIENLTRNNSLADIKSMVGAYQNPRDVDRITQGLLNNVAVPLPIILRGDSGMWIMAGNTRQATARVLGITPRALLVDVTA